MSIYTISSNKVPISLLNFSRYSLLANICISKASLHLGAWSYQSKGCIFGGYNWIFITTKYDNINGDISTIQVYLPNGSQLLSRKHYSSIWHSHKITSNKWSSIHWSTIISSCGNPTHPLQSRGSPMHPLQSHGSPTHHHSGLMHHSARIFANFILHLRA